MLIFDVFDSDWNWIATFKELGRATQYCRLIDVSEKHVKEKEVNE
jgi:hypothetical protein